VVNIISSISGLISKGGASPTNLPLGERSIGRDVSSGMVSLLNLAVSETSC
jgi:hypothetical protein